MSTVTRPSRLPEVNRYLDQTAMPSRSSRSRLDSATGRRSGASSSSSTRAARPRIGSPTSFLAKPCGKAPSSQAVPSSRLRAARRSIAMALASAQMGLKFVAVMPEGVSRERRTDHRGVRRRGDLFSPRAGGVKGAMEHAVSGRAERVGFLPLQFSNPDNPASSPLSDGSGDHRADPGGCVDAVVSGVGTGGTLVGLCQGFGDFGREVAAPSPLGRRRAGSRRCRVLLVQRADSGRGRGALDDLQRGSSRTSLVELDVADDEALEVARRLIRRGFPVGPSSGLNFQAAMMAARPARSLSLPDRHRLPRPDGAVLLDRAVQPRPP